MLRLHQDQENPPSPQPSPNPSCLPPFFRWFDLGAAASPLFFLSQTELFIKNPSRFADVARAHVEQHARQDLPRANHKEPPAAAGGSSSDLRPATAEQVVNKTLHKRRERISDGFSCVVRQRFAGCLLAVSVHVEEKAPYVIYDSKMYL